MPNKPPRNIRTNSSDPRSTVTTVPAVRVLMRAMGVIKSKFSKPKDRRASTRGNKRR